MAQPELRSESSVDGQVRGADESDAEATIGAKTSSKNEKVVEQSWNCELELFVFELPDTAERADELPVTKRSILKVIAGMYDPIGLLCPVLVGMKVLFQEL